MPPTVLETQRPLWQRRWFQVMLAVLLGLLLASFIVPPIFGLIYELRSVLLPVVIGFILAYIANPAITTAQLRYCVPRWASTAAIMFAGVLVVATFLLLAVPPMVAQGAELVIKAREVYPTAVRRLVETAESLRIFEPIERLPTRLDPPIEATGDVVIADPTPVDDPTTEHVQTAPETELDPAIALRAMLDDVVAWLQQLDWSTVGVTVARSLDIGVGVVAGAIGLTTYLFLAGVIIAFCFFYFAWRFDRIIHWFAAFIPASQRQTTYSVVRQMDKSVSAFIRGRLIQVAVMTVILSIGWLIAGVPYWLLLGVLTGLLNLVPFVPVFGWLLALVLTLIDHAAGTHGVTLWTFLGPSLVYFLAQGIDGWVIEPVVQGAATNLDPLTVLLVVLIGGSLAGLLGMLIAIPTAACIKILAKEVLLPRLRELAAKT
jgi:predicted PurR-regulated permease PerM